MKLRSTIFAILLALGVLPLLTLVAVNLRGHMQKHDEIEEQRTVTWAESNALSLNARAANIGKALFLAAATSRSLAPGTDPAGGSRLEHLLATLLNAESALREVVLLDRHGRETVRLAQSGGQELRAVPVREGELPAYGEYLRAGLQLGRFEIASFTPASPGGPGQDLLTLVTPVAGGSGTAEGVLLARIDTDSFLSGHRNAYWTDARGTVLHLPSENRLPPGGAAEPGAIPALGGDAFALYPGLRESMAEKRPFVWQNKAGLVITWVPLLFNPDHAPALWLGTPVDRSAAEEWKRSLLSNIIVIVLAITVVVSLIASAIARKIDRIRSAILAGLDAILNRGEENVRFAWTGPREVVTLAEELTSLARHHTATSNKHREAEAALRESEDKFRNLTATAQDAIAIMDHHGNITYWNKAATEIFGFAAEEAMGKPIHALIAPRFSGDGRREFAGIMREGDGPIRETLELIATRKDGREVPIELSLSEARVREQWNSIWIIRDITDRKRAEEEARLQQQQLVQADKMISLGVLISGVAHEINNPNSIAMLNAAMLRRAWESARPVLDEFHGEHGDFPVAGLDYSEMREQVPRLFSELEESARRIRNIVQDLKDYARQDTTRSMEDLDINEVAEAAIRLNANKIKNATRRFRTELAPDLPPVLGNRQRLEQVLINLIQNSCEALTSPEESVTVASRLDEERREVVVTVRDRGAGIRPEHLNRITDPFFTTKRTSGGTGLGLSVSAGIVKEHRGRLGFSSSPEQGTVATVSFPVAPDRKKQQEENR